MAAADASRAAPSRSRVVARGLVQAAQVAVCLVVLLRALAELPWVAAAAPSVIRVAASFLAPQRFCFVLLNVIVILLATFFAPDAASFSSTVAGPSVSPSSSINGDAPEQHPFLKLLEDPVGTLTSITESEPSGEMVFEDKEVVHVKTKARAQPPRRTMSEKTGGGAAGRTATAAAEAAPELRRVKSENSKRRQRRSAAAAATTAAAPAELVTDDAEAFRQAVEAFIAKQQTWFREESLIIAHGGGAGGEDGPALAGAAAVAVK